MFGALAALFVVTVVSALAKGIVSHTSSSIQQNRQYELNSRLMDQQAGLNRAQYDYEYEKESPARRMQQYMEAGLNPALMYSNGVAGMQGSVSGVSGSSVGIPNLSNLFDMSESINAMDKLGLTEPAKVSMDLDKQRANLFKSLKGHEDIKAGISQATKDALDGSYSFTVTNSDGSTSTVEVAGKFVEMARKIESYKKDLLGNDKAQYELSKWREYFDAQVSISNATATKAQADAFVAELDRKVVEQLENDGIYSQSKRAELLKSLEQCRRYMEREFEGSTTEFIYMWTQIATSIVDSVNPLGLLKFFRGKAKMLSSGKSSIPSKMNGMDSDDFLEGLESMF